MDVDSALARLGLDRSADITQVKRSFRRLAHDHHPDRGGDATRFTELSLAYRVLLEHHEPRPAPPRVAQGRPSRAPTSPVIPVSDRGPSPTPEPLAAQELATLRAGALRLPADAMLLSRLLITGSAVTAGSALGAVDPPVGLRRVTLVSRAPSARRTVLAPLLAGGSSSGLRIGDPRDAIGGGMRATDASRRGTAVVLTARARSARRAVTALELDAHGLGATWRRERGDTSVRLQTQLELPSDLLVAARSVALTVDLLLEALDWPLSSWSFDPECLHG
jgi:hypothetical protein